SRCITTQCVLRRITNMMPSLSTLRCILVSSHPPHIHPIFTPRPPKYPLFPYATLFRSPRAARPGCAGRDRRSARRGRARAGARRSEEHTSELQSHLNFVCRLLLEKKKTNLQQPIDLTANAITSLFQNNTLHDPYMNEFV